MVNQEKKILNALMLKKFFVDLFKKNEFLKLLQILKSQNLIINL